MNLRSYLLAFLAAFTLLSCGSSEEEGEDRLTATINGEEWEFINVRVNRENNPDGDVIEINATGYLEGDRGAIPTSLMMEIIGLPSNEGITTPFEISFAPSTTGTAAHATIEPEGSAGVFDTKLDINTEGIIVITDINESQMSGEFRFTATDQQGRSLEVENGKFNDLHF